MNRERLMQILQKSHISEKSTMVADKNRQYVFKVLNSANKREIGRAVEDMFNVKVTAVRVCNVKGKAKRFGQMEGRRKNWKKAYVLLQEGYDINFADAE